MRAKKRKALAAGVLGAAAVLATATPASAATLIDWTYTTDSNPGGSARFVYDGGYKFQVCDRTLDGLRAEATLYQYRGTKWEYVDRVADTTTNGECVVDTVGSSALKGTSVFFRICRVRSSDWAKFDCNASATGIA
ncbi:hypothetical protein ACQP1W_21690 [Spirillospora sp. CA-255316]